MSNLKDKFNTLTSKRIISLLAKRNNLLKIPPSNLNTVKIKIIKDYLDQRSYSLVAIYKFPSKNFVGIANSDGQKKYSFLVSQFLSKANFKDFIPQPYFYDENYGLFLREFIAGKTFGEILKNKKNVKIYLEKIANTISVFQKIKLNSVSPQLKTNINFNDFLKNIQILKKRKNNKAKKLAIIFQEIKEKIKNQEKQVLAHGDFNPYNFLFNRNDLRFIDFEKTHLGERIIDLANFCSQIDSPDFNFLEHKEEIKNYFLESYQKITFPFTPEEKTRFKFYKLYFDLLILTHILVWNPGFSELEKYEDNIFHF